LFSGRSHGDFSHSHEFGDFRHRHTEEEDLDHVSLYSRHRHTEEEDLDHVSLHFRHRHTEEEDLDHVSLHSHPIGVELSTVIVIEAQSQKVAPNNCRNGLIIIFFHMIQVKLKHTVLLFLNLRSSPTIPIQTVRR